MLFCFYSDKVVLVFFCASGFNFVLEVSRCNHYISYFIICNFILAIVCTFAFENNKNLISILMEMPIKQFARFQKSLGYCLKIRTGYVLWFYQYLPCS